MKKNVFDEYLKYWETVTPKLIEAENAIHSIKSSKEWRRVSNYFNVLYQRGQLKTRPVSKNGYKIERGAGVISISDLEDILTPEQLAEVAKRAN